MASLIPTAVMSKSWPNVITIPHAKVPCLPYCRLGMDEYPAASWSQWCGIKIIFSKEDFPS